MEGPKAPRDPEKMRPYFYILRTKKFLDQNRKMEPESSSCMRVTED